MTTARSPGLPYTGTARSTSLRRAALFYAIAFALTLGLALVLPHAGITPLLAIPTPVIATALVITFATPRGERRAAWVGTGILRMPSWRGLVIGLLGPIVLITVSFAAAAAVGVVRFPNLSLAPGAIAGVLRDVGLTLVIFAVIFLGEEIGWRGYLLPRLREVTTGRRAAVLTGICHAVFHLPLLLIATTYQSAGNRLIVVPMVMVTLTFGGVFYAWLRLRTGSIWPVSLAHSTFNNVMEGFAKAGVASSPAALAYVTTETGVFTLIVVVLFGGWLLVRRAADFERDPAIDPPTERNVPTAVA